MSGAPPPPRRRLHKGTSAGGNAINAVKQKRNQQEAVPPTFGAGPVSGVMERKPVSVQSVQTFELPDTERIDRDEALDKLAHASQSKYLYENNPEDEDYEYLLDEVPETSVGEGVDIKGELQFVRLLRIDGTFEGRLDSVNGSVVIGRSGCLIGDVKGMDALIIDGGKMIGDAQVQRLVIRGTGYLKGGLAAKSVTIGQHSTVIGRANIHSLAPEIVDSNGDIVVDEPEIDLDPLEDPEFEDEDYVYEEEGGGHDEGDGHDEEKEPAGEEAEAETESGKSTKKSKKSKKSKKADSEEADTAAPEAEAAAPEGVAPEAAAEEAPTNGDEPAVEATG